MTHPCRLLILGSALFAAIGCEADRQAPPAQPNPPQAPQASPAPPAPRPETTKLEAARAVGYGGVRERVDDLLNQNDQRNKEIERAATQR